ncbi:MAG: hypothetical protein SNH94_03585 [Rikenellaceae bacterium]
MLVIIVAVAVFFNFNGSIELTAEEQLARFMAQQGALKIGFFVVLAALYPLFGFVKREVKGDIVENRGQIIVAMETSGFTLKRESEGALIFGANTFLRRIAFLFEDSIVVTQRGENIHIEGVRRGVVYVVYCLDGFIKNSKNPID